MKTPTSKSLLTDSEVRKIYESRLPEFRNTQSRAWLFYRNVITRTIEEKQAIVYKMKAKYLNQKSV
jgi:hypothetical protein